MITTTIRYELQDGVAVVTFDEQGSPVNTMSLQWQDDLAAVTAQVLADKAQLRGVVLASAKKTFFAGADLKGVMRSNADDAPRVFAEIEHIKRHFRTLETLGVPVVTAFQVCRLVAVLVLAEPVYRWWVQPRHPH